MRHPPLSLPGVAIALWMTAGSLMPPAAAEEAGPTAKLIAEARRAFTLDGKPIPPEIFRDFGDGDLADSEAIWVTVDARAAIGSNLYADDIRESGGWLIQGKPAASSGRQEETAYKYIGAGENGLLVVLAAYSGGGSGNFITLHILDLAVARAFALDGKLYERLNLTNLRSIPLGDRWDGKISIAKNTITVVTTRKGPADTAGKPETTTIEARRP